MTAALQGKSNGTQGALVVNGVEAVTFNANGVLRGVLPPIRQTVLNGPVDTNGLPSFGGGTGGSTVTAAGTLTVAAAGGLVDIIGTAVNPSWTGLTTNGTMFLYLDVAADGTCTPGATSLAPTYRWGGADVVTPGQSTFNIQEMLMKVGNGTTAAQTYRVFVGEVTVAGAVVTAITWYALMGRYDSGFTVTLPGAGVTSSKNHNIGTYPERAMLVVECTSPDGGYAVGDRLVGWMHGTNGSTSTPNTPFATRLACAFTTNNGTAFIVPNKTGGAFAPLTATSWKWKITTERGW